MDLIEPRAHAAVASWRIVTGAVPVQIDGRLTDGRWFYFRARHDTAAVGLSRHSLMDAIEQTLVPTYRGDGPDVDSMDDGRAFALRRGVEGAGWLAPQEAHDLLGSLLTDIRDHVLETVTW